MKKILFGFAALVLAAAAAVSVASSGATCDPASCPKHCCESK
jgi:hypothetical protein